MTGPTPDHLRAQRRELIRQHHPDHGGDVDRFVEVLAALDARLAASTTRPDARPVTHPVGSGAPGGARRRRRAVRALQASLPRRLPGAKRYATY